MKKIAGSRFKSGSISQRHGSADPDSVPHQNVMVPQHRVCVPTYFYATGFVVLYTLLYQKDTYSILYFQPFLLSFIQKILLNPTVFRILRICMFLGLLDPDP
jgi:hypothetical protein